MNNQDSCFCNVPFNCLPLFGREGKKRAVQQKETEQTNDISKANEDLQDVINLLQAQEKKILKQCLELKKKAKQFAKNKDKNHAISCLRERKRKQNTIQTIISKADYMTSWMDQITDIQITEEITKVVASNTKILKKIMGNIDPDKMDDAIDDADEAQELVNQLMNHMNQSMDNKMTGKDGEIDMDDLMEEYDSLLSDDEEILVDVEVEKEKDKKIDIKIPTKDPEPEKEEDVKEVVNELMEEE